MLSKTHLLLAATFIAAASASVQAQTPAQGGMAQGGMAGMSPPAASAGTGEMGTGEMGMARMMRGMMAMSPADHIEGRIAYRKAELAITDAQLPQWNALATVMRANSRAMQDGMAMMAKDGMPTAAPARGEAMVRMMTARLDGMKAMVQADTALYAVLSPDQRKTADQMMMGMMGAI